MTLCLKMHPNLRGSQLWKAMHDNQRAISAAELVLVGNEPFLFLKGSDGAIEQLRGSALRSSPSLAVA